MSRRLRVLRTNSPDFLDPRFGRIDEVELPQCAMHFDVQARTLKHTRLANDKRNKYEDRHLQYVHGMIGPFILTCIESRPRLNYLSCSSNRIL